eukprot:m.339739 g.339739  ORF g.339739 m.339739 type:complete len:201 (+) comp18942_c0_seq1:80-682(+)
MAAPVNDDEWIDPLCIWCCPPCAVLDIQGCAHIGDNCGACFLCCIYTGVVWTPKWPPLPPSMQQQGFTRQQVAATQAQPQARASNQPWYRVPCSRQEAEQSVLSGAPGGFVVRNSSKAGAHVLVVNDHGKVQNIQITRDMAGNHMVKGGTPFPSLDQLIASLGQGSSNPLMSTHPDSPNVPLYLRTGQAVSSQPAMNFDA